MSIDSQMRSAKEARILNSVKGYRNISNFILHTYIFYFSNLSPVRVLQIWVQSAFYKFESSPRFTNLSPVHILQIWVQSAFYKSSLVRVLQQTLESVPSSMRWQISWDNHHGNPSCTCVGDSSLSRHRFQKFIIHALHTCQDSLCFHSGDRFEEFARTVCVSAG